MKNKKLALVVLTAGYQYYHVSLHLLVSGNRILKAGGIRRIMVLIQLQHGKRLVEDSIILTLTDIFLLTPLHQMDIL